MALLLAIGMVGQGLSAHAAAPGVNRSVYGAPRVAAVQAASDAPVEQPFVAAPATRVALDGEEAELVRSVAAFTVDHAALQRLAVGKASALELPTPEGQVLTVDLKQIRTRSADSRTLIGGVRGSQEGHAVLVYHKGVLSGSVSRYDIQEHYELKTLKDGKVVVRLLHNGAFTADCGTDDDAVDPEVEHADGHACGNECEHAQVPAPTRAAGPALAADADVVTMDIVVGYGAAARDAEGGTAQIEALIIASVDRMNTAFANSIVTNVELVLLGTIEDPDYVYPGATSGSMSSNDELGDLNSHGDGNLDAVSQLRIDLGADLNAFVIKSADGSAGIAYRPGRSCIVARTYMSPTRITFVHEVGHNIGCRHSWGDSDCGTSGHGRGWRFKVGSTKYRSVMAYDWGWSRVPYFSNPDVLYPGSSTRTGAADGYDVTGDTTTDASRYLSGGYNGSCTNNTGYDGSHATLGANNANYIRTYAASVEDNATRASLGVTAPMSNELLPQGAGYTVEWVGGVFGGSLDLDLYTNGVFDRALASGLDNNDWAYGWTVPADLENGSNYTIVATVDGTLVATSAAFRVFDVVLACDTTDLSPQTVTGADPSADTFEVWQSGSSTGTMAYTIGTSEAWLSATPNTGASTGEHDVVQIDYDTSALAAGSYAATITISAPGAADSPKTISVDLTVSPPPPTAQSVPYAQAFAAGLPSNEAGWEYYSDNQGRIRVLNGELLMDDSVDGGAYSLNEATLHLDLAGQTNVLLTFDHTDYSDEDHDVPLIYTAHADGDGVSISSDGSIWYGLSVTTSFVAQVIDLDAAAAAAGIAYTSDFQIKFQQYDNYAYSTDGRAFDNISVSVHPAIAAVELDSGGVTLSVDSATNWLYVLYCTTNLLEGSWTPISTNAGDGSLLQINSPNSPNPAFYQLRLLPPE